MTDLAVHPTDIPGLLIVDLPVHGDSRGWFKENWHRAKMTALGLPDFAPVQHNVSFNDERGVTRGIHAEPWDKYVSVVTGAIFGAWVDLREGPTHGQVVTCEIGPDRAVFVPRGVGNSYQTLEPAMAYSYLVTEHWSPAARDRYTFVALHDTSLGIDWPIPFEETIRSEADLGHPLLADSIPVRKPHTLVLGAGGQPGRALLATLPNAVGLTRAECDLADPVSVDALDLADVDAIVNAAAYIPRSMPPRRRRGAATPGRSTSAGSPSLSGAPVSAASHSSTSPPTTSSTAPAGSTAREDSAPCPWGCMARPRPPATPWSPRTRSTTSSARAGSSVTARTSSRRWPGSPTAASAPPSSTNWPGGSPSHGRPRRRDRPPAVDGRALRHVQPEQHRPEPGAGPTSPPTSSSCAVATAATSHPSPQKRMRRARRWRLARRTAR